MISKKLRKVGRLQFQYSKIILKLLIRLALSFGSEIHQRNFATFFLKMNTLLFI